MSLRSRGNPVHLDLEIDPSLHDNLNAFESTQNMASS
eukprot:CAMPEP_0184684542 /NCGR_PEP_ID=MMETSP0312-20130426/15715_1 /TAXON_ID=31354 /ORGANISM="Compsopogon coeruleus, Strain SAG 36.94" /LENGTH=36 /DNA_ID= /DNA_START= /DNA_END= /DNA_ORIENTATION=